MPNPPAQPPTSNTTLKTFTAGQGAALLPAPDLVLTTPADQPPVNAPASSTLVLIGADAVQFSLGSAGSVTVTFPQLPYRNNTTNPLAPPTNSSQPLYTVQPISHLLFFVFVQGTTAASATPFALDMNNIVCPGPFLGANSFRTFQATVTSTGAASGFVTALLLLSAG